MKLALTFSLSALALAAQVVVGPVAIDAPNNAVRVNCVVGCSASAGATYGAAMPSAGSPIAATDGTNAQPIKVDGSGNLLVNVAAGSGSVPTGSAGTPSTSVVTVQGIASMTKLLVTPDLPSGASTSANQTTGNSSLASIDGKTPALGQALAAASVPVVLTAAQISTLTPPSSITANAGTNLNTSALALESGGNLATLASVLGAKADAKSTATDTTAISIMQVLKEISAMEQAPASRAVTNAGTFAVQIAANSSVNLSQVSGTTPDTNSGVKSAGTLRVVLATDQPQLTNKLLVTPDANSAINVAQINGVTPLMGNGLTGTGSQRVTIASDNTAFSVNAIQSGTWTVQPGNTANTTPWLVQSVPGTSGGNSNYVLEPAASDNHAVIKNGAGQVYSITAFNNSGTVNYLRLYNAGTGFNGCNSATNLLWEGHIPANTSDAGFIFNSSQGIAFGTGISICVTGGYGQTNTTNATASAISLDVEYK